MIIKKNWKSSKGGIISYIIIILAVAIALAYFGFDLRGIIESPQVQENIQYVWNAIKPPILWIWALIQAIWDKLVSIPQNFGDNFNDIAPEARLESFEAGQ